jgi:hypothetical protein
LSSSPRPSRYPIGGGHVPSAARPLVKPLERALRAIEKHHGQQARAQHETFLRTVGRYRDRAILDGPGADDLTDAAEAVIAAL